MLAILGSIFVIVITTGPSIALYLTFRKLQGAGKQVMAGAIIALPLVTCLVLNSWNPIGALVSAGIFLVPSALQLVWLASYFPVYAAALGLLLALSTCVVLGLSIILAWRKILTIAALAGAFAVSLLGFDLGVQGYVALSARQSFGDDYRITAMRSPFESVSRSWSACASGHHAKLERSNKEYHWSYRSGWVETDHLARCSDGPSPLIGATIIAFLGGVVSWLYALIVIIAWKDSRGHREAGITGSVPE